MRLEILELELGVSWKRIESKYEYLTHLWHPDRFDERDRERLDVDARYQSLHDAYRWLSDHKDFCVCRRIRKFARPISVPCQNYSVRPNQHRPYRDFTPLRGSICFLQSCLHLAVERHDL